MPARVRAMIEERAEAAGFSALKRAAGELSEAYREGKPTRMPAADHVAAYLVTRMPATWAAARAALGEAPEWNVASILDVGAGSGAAALAAADRFPGARDFTLVERDPSLADEARQFLPQARVLAADAEAMREFPPHDLVIAAYSLGEMGRDLTEALWAAARVALVVIEPGTPRGAARIALVRERLLALGAHMAAPCPAAMPCPLAAPDGCHFAARVERSSLHRRVKDGELGYEDEKYSYVAVARQPAKLGGARVLRHPRHHPGLIELELCTAEGPRHERVTKRDRERFRAARRAAWGTRFGGVTTVTETGAGEDPGPDSHGQS
ncbi:MAG: methyltransferase domain-containing protein [Acidobacteria bacterium]|nr:methyltransferase domain-containing protein [Acidobacteriota bacterium]